MMPTERFERQLPELLTDLAAPRTPDYLDDLLWQTANTSQRPAWSLPERWLSMLDVVRQPVVAPPLPWRTIGLGFVLLALLLAMVAAFVVGGRPNPPAPFGPARTGLVAYASNGDIVTVDAATGESTTIVSGPETDLNPRWSLDGSRLAFERRSAGRGLVFVVNADGSDVTRATPTSLDLIDFSFSPDGRELLISARLGLVPSIFIAKTDGSGVRVLSVGSPATEPQWRPSNGTEILFVDDFAGSIHAVDPISGHVRTIVARERGQSRGHARWSPDGSRISYTRWVDAGPGLTAQIHVVAADGSGDRTLDLPPGAVWQADAYWSNDGTQLVVTRGYTGGFEESVAVVLPADGSGYGTEIDYSSITNSGCCAIWEWAPDDASILATATASDTDTTLDQFLVEPKDGTARHVPWTSNSRPSWQRLAP